METIQAIKPGPKPKTPDGTPALMINFAFIAEDDITILSNCL